VAAADPAGFEDRHARAVEDRQGVSDLLCKGCGLILVWG
jgi:hypothetical protein